MPSHSIVVRVRRTRVDEVHVAVPVTDQVMRTDEHGETGLDVAKVFAEAVVIARTTPLSWRDEGVPTVEVHPIQTPRTV